MKKIALMALAIFFASGSAYCMQPNKFPKSPDIRRGVARKITTPKPYQDLNYLEADKFLRQAMQASQSTTPAPAPTTTFSDTRESDPLNLRGWQRKPVRHAVVVLSEYEMYRQRENDAHDDDILNAELVRLLSKRPDLRALLPIKKDQ